MACFPLSVAMVDEMQKAFQLWSDPTVKPAGLYHGKSVSIKACRVSFLVCFVSRCATANC
jgi:hypothetical protein